MTPILLSFVVVVCLAYSDGVSSLDARVMIHFNRTRLERCGEGLNPISLGYTCDFILTLASIHRKSFSARQLDGGCRGSQQSVICARRCKTFNRKNILQHCVSDFATKAGSELHLQHCALTIPGTSERTIVSGSKNVKHVATAFIL